MQFNIPLKPRPDPESWSSRFAWLPTRISDSHVVWLERYLRRSVTVDEGCWAGGYKWRYEFAQRAGQPGGVWAGPVQGE